MSDAARPRKEILLDIAVGIGVSIFAGVMVTAFWSLQSLSRLGSPFYCFPIPLVMGLAGAFWWRRQWEGGWPLWGIVIAETIVIPLLFLLILLPFGWLNEPTGIMLMIYIMVSPLMVIGMYIGARFGFWLLNRRAARAPGRREPDSEIG